MIKAEADKSAAKHVNMLKEKDSKISDLEAAVAARNDKVAEMEERLAGGGREAASLREELMGLRGEVEELKSELGEGRQRLASVGGGEEAVAEHKRMEEEVSVLRESEAGLRDELVKKHDLLKRAQKEMVFIGAQVPLGTCFALTVFASWSLGDHARWCSFTHVLHVPFLPESFA